MSSKLKLSGLDIAIKERNNTIQITPADDFFKKFINSKSDISIESLEDGEVVNGTMTDNLMKVLIVCSNYYLPESVEQEDICNIKTKLEKLIRKGLIVKIKKFTEDASLIQLVVNVNGEDKYYFYASNVVDVLRMTQEHKMILKNIL